MKRVKISIATKTFSIPLRVIGVFGFFVIMFTSYLAYNGDRASAQLATFYPTTCLGGWKNVEKATGSPEAERGMVNEYNDSNSASVSNSTSQIFCGGFRGEIPEDTLQKRIVVKFSWAERNNNTLDRDTEGTQKPDPTQSEIVPTEGEVLSGELEPEVLPEKEFEETEPVMPRSDVGEAEPEPAAATDKAQEAPSEPEPEAGETKTLEPTLLNLITTKAHAEGTENFLSDGRLEIFYTIDGEYWKSLGFVKDINNGVNFEMPRGSFTTVEDLGKVQIAIHTIPSYDNVHTIYLDSVWLEVEYESPDARSAKGITNFKIFLLSQDKLETEVNDWLSLQKNIEVDDIKVEDYGGGGYLVVISYHGGGILGNSTARLKLITGENPEADAQTFLSTLTLDQSVKSITATSGAFSNQQTTITVPIIFIVYE